MVLAVGGVAVLRLFLHRDSRHDATNILALLWTGKTAIKQSDIVQSEKISGEDVARALVRLEGLGLVRRKWDSSACTYLVQATISSDGKPQ